LSNYQNIQDAKILVLRGDFAEVVNPLLANETLQQLQKNLQEINSVFQKTDLCESSESIQKKLERIRELENIQKNSGLARATENLQKNSGMVEAMENLQGIVRELENIQKNSGLTRMMGNLRKNSGLVKSMENLQGVVREFANIQKNSGLARTLENIQKNPGLVRVLEEDIQRRPELFQSLSKLQQVNAKFMQMPDSEEPFQKLKLDIQVNKNVNQIGETRCIENTTDFWSSCSQSGTSAPSGDSRVCLKGDSEEQTQNAKNAVAAQRMNKISMALQVIDISLKIISLIFR
jgi:protein subunit release factor A